MNRKKSVSPKRSPTGYKLGREGFAKISAVEGLVITATMEADFRDFDRKGLSENERRSIISRKYGKVR